MSGTVWTKFFWADWQSDPALRLCSYAARGLWMDMLCIAAAHDPIGYVAVAGRGLSETDIARMTGGSESEVHALLGDLERNGVFSRDRKGTIYSRRMIADARKAAISRKNGKNGGNPKLCSESVIPASDKGSDMGALKPQEPESNNQEPEDPSLRSGDCAEPARGSPPSDPHSKADPSDEKAPEEEAPPPEIVHLPTNRFDTTGEEVVITERDAAEWRPVYPGVNVDQALQKMRQWLVTHRAQRKTARGMRAFVTAWLSRDQDRCGRFGPQPGSLADPNRGSSSASPSGLPAPPEWGDRGKALSEMIGQNQYAQWFGGGCVRLIDGDPVHLEVDGLFRWKWITNHFDRHLKTVFGDGVVIESPNDNRKNDGRTA